MKKFAAIFVEETDEGEKWRVCYFHNLRTAIKTLVYWGTLSTLDAGYGTGTS